MAIPLSAHPHGIRVPAARPVTVRARITSPLAVHSDSYLGGFASGRRLVYVDAREFVWWAPTEVPDGVAAGAGFSRGFSSGFEGGIGSPTGPAFSTGFSSGFGGSHGS